jgi:hypothetical protein
MLYVVVDELIPESCARGKRTSGDGSARDRFALMLALDHAFG